jgi:hypothetical protein
MNYTELVAAVESELDRTDVSGDIPLWIELAEAGFTATPETGGIRHWRMEKRSQVDVQEQYLSVPPGYIETIRMFNQSNGNRMELMSREAMQESRDYTNDQAGIPTHYRHGSDGTFALWPTPASLTRIEMEYYQRVGRLNKDDYGTGVVQSNWVSDLYPDVYLYGTLVHSAPYLHDDARIGTWSGLYSAAVGRLNAEARRAESSTSSPRLRNRGMPDSRVPGVRGG